MDWAIITKTTVEFLFQQHFPPADIPIQIAKLKKGELVETITASFKCTRVQEE